MLGINKDKKLIEARKRCAYCEEEFETNETKRMVDGLFYHPDCYDDLVNKHRDDQEIVKCRNH